MAEEKKKEVAEEAVFLKTTAALDLERREEDARLTQAERLERDRTEGRDFTGDGNDTSGYVGVGLEYMNYATPADKPYKAGEDSAVGRLEAEYTRGSAVAEVVEPESNQTEGGGSQVPLVYAHFAGEDFENHVVTAEEAKAEAERLAPKGESVSASAKPAPAPAPTPAKAAAVPVKTSK